MSQCCCGRFKELSEPSAINDTLHEPLGPPESFCGPIINHTLRDVLAANEAISAKNSALLARIKEFDESIASEFRDPNGTIWEVANRALADLATLRKAVVRMREAMKRSNEWCVYRVQIARGSLGADSAQSCGTCMDCVMAEVDAAPGAVGHKAESSEVALIATLQQALATHALDDLGGCTSCGGIDTHFDDCEISHLLAPGVLLAPVPLVLHCPAGHPHVDEGEWATRPHKTHKCQAKRWRGGGGPTPPDWGTCGLEWRPAEFPTVGVKR